MESTSATSNTAVWYFVGATFIFVAPLLFLPDANVWLRVGSLALGGVVLVAGLVVFRREYRTRDSKRGSTGGGER